MGIQHNKPNDVYSFLESDELKQDMLTMMS